jgi:hypothetical protein
MGRQITRDEAAALAGIKPDTFSAYVVREQAPAPVRFVGRTPLWDETKVKTWAENRPGQGVHNTPRARRRAAARADSAGPEVSGS